MLSLEQMGLHIDGQPLLQDISLSLAEGEIVSVLGPSGSGKTSLLRVVMGLSTPTEGRLTLDDTELAAAGRLQVLPHQRPIAFLFQDFTLLPHLDVRGNILVGLCHLPREEQRRRLDGLTGLLGLSDIVRRPVLHLRRRAAAGGPGSHAGA